MIQIVLGKPDHGWVDLHLSDGSFQIVDSISDVPADFIDQTVQQLIKLLKNENTEPVFLGLEPDHYVWSFDRTNTHFVFEMKKGFDAPLVKSPVRLHKAAGTLHEIIKPFFLELSAFYARDVEGPDWPDCDAANLQTLAALWALNVNA